MMLSVIRITRIYRRHFSSEVFSLITEIYTKIAMLVVHPIEKRKAILNILLRTSFAVTETGQIKVNNDTCIIKSDIPRITISLSPTESWGNW